MSEMVAGAASDETVAQRKRREARAERDALHSEILRVREEFESIDFVKIDGNAYLKSTLAKVSFGDTKIYARFTTGDIIEVTEEQLYQFVA